MNFQRRTFRAPDEPCESDNELNGCRKSLKIEFRQQETTNTQNLDESTGCTKSLKKTPSQSVKTEARAPQEHSSSVETEPRAPQEHSRSIETERSTPTAPRSSEQRHLTNASTPTAPTRHERLQAAPSKSSKQNTQK